MSALPAPSFVTFTGLGRPRDVRAAVELARRYPVEWGVLIDSNRSDDPLFPNEGELASLRSAPLRLSAHVCGTAARSIVSGAAVSEVDLAGFSRVQINHGRAGASDAQIAHVARFAAIRGVRAALQCQGSFPDDSRVDWLYDVSFGEGRRPTTWPAPSSAFCGYSGGISPDTIAATLSALPRETAGRSGFWLDMESGVRTDGQLDLSKCEAVCRVAFGR